MFKQPRVPEYRESDGVTKYIKALTLFLKDFCQDVWMESRNTNKGVAKAQDSANNAQAGVDAVKYPVTSVNKKTGDVTLAAADVGAVKKTGDIMTGSLSAVGITVTSTGLYPSIEFDLPGGKSAGILQANGTDDFRRFGFYQYHQDQDGASTKYYDGYRLPKATPGRTAHASYDILTTKDLVTVAQGGTGAKNAEQARKKLGAVSVDDVYPVGSVVQTTSEDKSPAELFGGDWVLIDSAFDGTYLEDDDFFTINSDVVNTFYTYAAVNGHTVTMRLSFSPKVDLTDTAAVLGTVNWAALGLDGMPFNLYAVGVSDEGNGVSLGSLNKDTGELKHTDYLVRTSGATLVAGDTVNYCFSFVALPENLLTSACDLYTWERDA